MYIMLNLWNYFYPSVHVPTPVPLPIPTKENILFDYNDKDTSSKTSFLEEQGFEVNDNRVDAYTVLGDGLTAGEICNSLTCVGADISWSCMRLVMQMSSLRAYKINTHINDIRVIDRFYNLDKYPETVAQSKEYEITEVTNSVSGGAAFTN
jgi:hypothetical protein